MMIGDYIGIAVQPVYDDEFEVLQVFMQAGAIM